MNRLFLRKKAEKYSIIWLFLSVCTGIFANNNIQSQAFNNHLNTSDAYLLYSYTDVTYTRSWGSYKREVSIQNKLVVNNKAGVEEFAFINLSEFVCNHLKTFNIKTTKADGSVVQLDSSIVFEQQSDDETIELTNYPIPGVEPGDTIVIHYVYSEHLDKHELMDYVNLYNQIPSINTEYTIKTTPDLSIIYKPYNGFPDPQVISNDSLVFCLFKMENIEGLSENQYTCLPCELPYIYYSVEEKDSEARTWQDVYNQEFNYITQPLLLDYEKTSYYKRWKRRILGEADDSSKYYQFNLLHQAIIETMGMEPAREEEFIKSSGYFLKEQRFDPISIRRLYRQLLEDLEIEYWAVFARTKRAGKIDPYYIRKGEFDHIFFAYETPEGALNLLYPHDATYKYHINEIPTSLYNTNAILAKPFLTEKRKKRDKFINYDLQVAEVDSVIIKIARLPSMNANFNNMKQVYFCDVDLDERSTTFKSNLSVSGGLSTDIRSFLNLLDQNKEMSDFYDALSEFEGDENALEIDSITKTSLNSNKPFVFKIDAQGTLNKSLSFLSDSVISLTLEDLINHTLIESEEDSIDLDYYLDYMYSDFFMLILNFPCPIEILNIDNYKKNYNNTCGEYLFNVTASGNNQLILQSNYKIAKDLIPKDEYNELKVLNDFVDEFKNKRLLIKLKGLQANYN